MFILRPVRLAVRGVRLVVLKKQYQTKTKNPLSGEYNSKSYLSALAGLERILRIQHRWGVTMLNPEYSLESSPGNWDTIYYCIPH